MNLSRLAITRPIGTFVIFGTVLLIGAVSLLALPINLLPDITFPRLTISTDYEGAGPEEVENNVSRILEEAVSTVTGVQDVTSTSTDGNSRVVATFVYGTDLDAAANDVRAAIERVRRRLPDGIGVPIVFKFDTSQFPILQMALVKDRTSSMTPLQMREFVDQQVVFRLERIHGVALVDVRGGVKRQILVELDRARMAGLGMSERDVISALAAANLAAPGGQVNEGTRRLGLRTLAQFRDLDQIRRTVVSSRNGVPIYVKDIATVTDGAEDVTGLVRVNGRNGVMIQIQRQPGFNTIAVSDAVLAEVKSINSGLRGTEIVVFNDNAQFIRSSVASLQEAVLIGGGLAIGVLAFFLRDLRSILIIGSAIPISIIATFGLMYFSGYSLNLMTFGGLALGVGMLVDASIVVLENIFRYREMGHSPRDAAIEGAAEVASPVIASIITHLVVFLPIILLRGGTVLSQIFVEFSMVVIFSLSCSLIVSLTLVPVLASLFPPRAGADAERGWSLRMIHGYKNMLDWSLVRRPLIYLAAGAIFVVGLGAYNYIGKDLLPVTDESEIFVTVELPVGTRLDLTDQTLQRFERAIRSAAPDEIKTITVQAGTATFGAQLSHRGNMRVRLVPKHERKRSTEAVAAELRQRLQVTGGRVIVRPSAGQFNILRAGTTDPIAVEVRGFDLARSLGIAQRVRGSLEEIPNVTDPTVERADRLPELSIRIDRDRAASFGLSPSQIASALKTSFNGATATIFRESGQETDVVVRLQPLDREQPQQVLNVPILAPGGRTIVLGQVAELVRGVGPAQIFRKNRQRTVTVSAGIAGRDFGSVMTDVQERIGRINLPDGFAIAYGDAFKEQQAANQSLLFGFLVSLVLVYAVMAVQFEEWREPLIIMGSVPFALSGAFLMLFYTKTTLNVQSTIGLVVLSGTVVSNAIVLIDFILVKQRRDGVPLYQAASEASAARLRPVLMSTLTTLLGLIPIAIGLGEGAEMQAPLARSVLGGLTLSTLVTLLFIPSLYVGVEEFRARRARRAHPVLSKIPSGAPSKAPAPIAGGSADEPSHPSS
jgi:HAE1 family hydrophobic/amphiphilic exporter-1